jgi:outer membrane biosynthesis protein TonB
MRRRHTSSFLLVSLSSSAVLLALACGGGDAKSPANAGSSSSGPPGTSSSGSGNNAGSGGGTTTTLQLGDAGDLQGAKLGTSSRTEIESKGEGTPKPAAGTSEPGRSPADLKTIIGGARRDEARACYDKGLKDHPGIEGDIDIKFVIDKDGIVQSAEVDSTKSSILEPSVGSCIVDVIKKIKFAPSAKGYETRAHYPFNFHPRNTPSKADAGK